MEIEKRSKGSIENLKQVLLEIQLGNLKNKPKSAKNRLNYLKIEIFSKNSLQLIE